MRSTRETSVVDSDDDSTPLTRTFSSRWVRNRSMELTEGAAALSHLWHNSLTGPVRAAAQPEDHDFISLFAGQAASLARRMPAGERMVALEAEIAQAIKHVSSLQA